MPKPHPERIPLATVESVFGLTIAEACERYARLTPRERQVATMMAAGLPNGDIAKELGITGTTLHIHRANVKGRLGARSTVDIANVVNLVRLAEAAQRDQ